MDFTAILLAAFAVLIVNVEGIMWKLHPNTHKCLKEELQSNVLVTGDYEVQDAPGQKVDYIVKDSKGHILSQKDDISKGKFSFVTENYDTFEICFISRVPPQQRGIAQEVSLVTKRGVEAKNYEGDWFQKPLFLSLANIQPLNFGDSRSSTVGDLGEVEVMAFETSPVKIEFYGLGEARKLKPLELELKRLEDLSDAIVQDFSQMRKREEEMRDTNESTNSRVLYFSIFSMCCLLGLATWQVLYLRRFFKAKKLIE